MVVGNHDTPNAEGKANTLDIYSALEIDNVFVSRKSELLNIETRSGNLQVITAPWLQKGDFKDLGEKLSQAAYKKVLEKFTLNRMISSYVSLYESLVDRH